MLTEQKQFYLAVKLLFAGPGLRPPRHVESSPKHEAEEAKTGIWLNGQERDDCEQREGGDEDDKTEDEDIKEDEKRNVIPQILQHVYKCWDQNQVGGRGYSKF